MPIFVGFHNSLISLDDTLTYWKLENINDPTTYATINVTEKDPLRVFGTHIWYFFNDTCTELGEKEGHMLYKKKISFTSCGQDMFNCGDGTW